MLPLGVPSLCATRLHNQTHFRLGVPLWPSRWPYSNRPLEDVALEFASNSHESPSGNKLFDAILGSVSPDIHRTISGSLAASTGPLALHKGIGPVRQIAHPSVVPLFSPRTRFRRFSQELPRRGAG